jgi:hypothetical protein
MGRVFFPFDLYLRFGNRNVRFCLLALAALWKW